MVLVKFLGKGWWQTIDVKLCYYIFLINAFFHGSHTHRTPDFLLHAVGRHGNAPGASFWRDYTLFIPDVLECFIRETFVDGLFEKYKGNPHDGTIWYNDVQL